MNIIKKQGLGTWITLITAILTLVGVILYQTALAAGTDLLIASGSQLFYEAIRPEDSAMMAVVLPCAIVGLVCLVAAIVLAQVNLEGIAGKVCECVVGILRIAAPVLVFVAMLYFAYGSLTGLGWTFFSNEELVIFPEAKAVGKKVVAGLIVLGIAAVASVVAAFFGMSKKEEK